MGDKMELKELIETRMYRVLKKKGYETVEDMARLFPRKYHDFSSLGCLDTNLDGEMGAYLCSFESYEKKKKNGKLIVKAVVREKSSKRKIQSFCSL